MTDLRPLHRRATDVVTALVADATSVDLDRPTPCAGWDLRKLLEHMIGQDAGFAASTVADVPAVEFAPRTGDSDPLSAYRSGAYALVEAFAVADVEQPARTEFGSTVSFETLVAFHHVDTVVHGWDVAASLGVPVDFDDEVLAAALRVAEQVPVGARRDEVAAFAQPLPAPDGASALDRTLRLLGRDPSWRSPA